MRVWWLWLGVVGVCVGVWVCCGGGPVGREVGGWWVVRVACLCFEIHPVEQVRILLRTLIQAL